MMDELQQREELIAVLEKVVREEIVLMRHMLTSLNDEHEAIVANDLSRMDRVMEDRLQLIEAFERIAQEAVVMVCRLDGCCEEGFSQELAIEHLQTLLTDDDLELQSLLTQRGEVLKEIYLRNQTNSVLLEQHMHRLSDEAVPSRQPHDGNPLSVTYGTNQKRLAKQALQVLDPNVK